MQIRRQIGLLVCSLLLFLAACAPSVEVEGPRTAVYQGNPEQVFSTILRAISTMTMPDYGQGLLSARPDPSGWVITQSDRAGGFLQTQLVVQRNMGGGYYEEIDRVSFVVSPAGNQRTSIVFQSVATEQANDLLAAVRTSLQRRFGAANTQATSPN